MTNYFIFKYNTKSIETESLLTEDIALDVPN